MRWLVHIEENDAVIELCQRETLAVAEPSAPHAWHALAQPWRVAIMARPADAWVYLKRSSVKQRVTSLY